MTNTVLFDLQAAAMAAAANSANPGRKLPNGEDIPEGMSFSDMLASESAQVSQAMQAVQGTQTDKTEQAGLDGIAGESAAAEGTEEAAAEETDNGIFSDALKLIENAGDGVKEALTLLLKTVLNALRGSSDGEERKTDMFMILTDGSAGFSDEDDMSEDMLLGAEIMNRLGLMIDSEIEKDTDTDLLFGELEKIVGQILGNDKDDTDETTAADALAALLNIAPAETESIELSFEGGKAKTEAVESAAEAFKAPMRAVAQEAPEKLSEAERLYSELEAKAVSETAPKKEETPELISRTGFAALKINNASEQVSNIGRKLDPEPKAETEEAPVQTVSEKNAEAGANVYRDGGERPGGGTDGKAESGTDSESKARTDVGTVYETEAAGAAAAENFTMAAGAETVFIRDEIGTDSVETRLGADTAFSVENQVKDVVTDEIAGFGDKDGVKELVLILRPRELGQIAVKLVKYANTVSVIMSAQYEEVGKLMTQRAAYLGESLSGRDYDVKDVQVVEPGNAAEQMGLNFTDHGFSFARNQNGSDSTDSGRGYRGENDGYGDIDGTEEIGAVRGDIRFREAKLWTTA